MRDVVDHHVDRTDVEAQQCVQLTVTNIPIDLSYPALGRVKLDSILNISYTVQSRRFDCDVSRVELIRVIS